MNDMRLFLILALLAPVAFAEDWPNWRGPSADNLSKDLRLPTNWTAKTNVAWRTPLPEGGNSTPIVWGGRVFLNQSEGKQRLLYCFDKANGKLLWKKGLLYEGKEPKHERNTFAASSPVTDGQSVFAFFGSAGLAAYDFDGKEKWKVDLGSIKHDWGIGSSPILWRDLVILNFGPGEGSRLVAFNKKTGKETWSFDIPDNSAQANATGLKDDSGWQIPGNNSDPNFVSLLYGAWSTPLIMNVKGKDQLIFQASRQLRGMDPASGKVLWFCRGASDLQYASPIPGELKGEPVVAVIGGFTGSAMLVKLGGSGDVTETHRVWHKPNTKNTIGTGVIYQNHLYWIENAGIAQCIDLATGRVVWTGRLRSTGGKAEIWSSIIRNGDKLYATNQAGDSFVFRAAPKFEVVAVNSIGEETNSTLVPSDGHFFLRTFEALWSLE